MSWCRFKRSLESAQDKQSTMQKVFLKQNKKLLLQQEMQEWFKLMYHKPHQDYLHLQEIELFKFFNKMMVVMMVNTDPFAQTFIVNEEGGAFITNRWIFWSER